MVAIRSGGLAFDSLVGYQKNGLRTRLVGPEYEGLLVGMANERFGENSKRITKFREALKEAIAGPLEGREGWEDKEARRERKRADGLRKAAEAKAKTGKESQPDAEELELGLNFGLGASELQEADS